MYLKEKFKGAPADARTRRTRSLNLLSAPEFGWCVYEWANSAFSTSVLAVFAGPYLTDAALRAGRADAQSLFPYLVSFSALLRLVALPLLDAVTDLSDRNRAAHRLFGLTGAFATILLGVAAPNDLTWLSLSFLFASFGWSASVVFYNALLPTLSNEPGRISRISCYGAAAGYLGGGIVLTAHLLFLHYALALKLDELWAVRICIISTGAWWAFFSITSFVLLRSSDPVKQFALPGRLWSKVHNDFRQKIAQMRDQPVTFRFLLAFSLYGAGTQTAMALAGQFALIELGIRMDQLAAAILALQMIAVPFPLLFDKLENRIGIKNALVLCLLIWTAVIWFTAVGIHKPEQFVVSVCGIAVVIAPTQALSRAWFSRLIPAGEEARMFSLYEIAAAAIGWCAPLLYGVALHLLGNHRSPLLSICIFLMGGVALLLTVPSDSERGSMEERWS